MKISPDLYPDVDAALQYAATLFGGTLIGTISYGWRRKSAGSKVSLVPDRIAWLRVQFADPAHLNERIWDGEIAGGAIKNVSKPDILAFRDWEDGGYLWRGTLMTFVEFPPCAASQELPDVAPVPEQTWFDELRRSLEQLANHKTTRCACRQDLITRRVAERFGSHIDTAIETWSTTHGDLHWANVTCPRMVILDWEGWGTGPKGLDSAFLLGYSCHRTEARDKISLTFEDWLSDRQGCILRLFVVSELLRMVELHGDHVHLQLPLEEMGKYALADLERCS